MMNAEQFSFLALIISGVAFFIGRCMGFSDGFSKGVQIGKEASDEH